MLRWCVRPSFIPLSHFSPTYASCERRKGGGMVEIWMNANEGWVDRYQARLARRPLLTQSVTTAVSCTSSSLRSAFGYPRVMGEEGVDTVSRYQKRKQILSFARMGAIVYSEVD